MRAPLVHDRAAALARAPAVAAERHHVIAVGPRRALGLAAPVLPRGSSHSRSRTFRRLRARGTTPGQARELVRSRPHSMSSAYDLPLSAATRRGPTRRRRAGSPRSDRQPPRPFSRSSSSASGVCSSPSRPMPPSTARRLRELDLGAYSTTCTWLPHGSLKSSPRPRTISAPASREPRRTRVEVVDHESDVALVVRAPTCRLSAIARNWSPMSRKAIPGTPAAQLEVEGASVEVERRVKVGHLRAPHG